MAFMEGGGTQINPCCVGVDDLRLAMDRPDDWRGLVVRIGGFSARFVELSPVVQKELLLRYTYDA
jgi:pyruvate-formate lyase